MKCTKRKEFKKWQRDTEVAIENIFGQESRHVADFTSIRYSLSVSTSSTPESAWKQAFLRGLENADAVILSLIDEITEYWEDDDSPSNNLTLTSSMTS